MPVGWRLQDGAVDNHGLMPFVVLLHCTEPQRDPGNDAPRGLKPSFFCCALPHSSHSFFEAVSLCLDQELSVSYWDLIFLFLPLCLSRS